MSKYIFIGGSAHGQQIEVSDNHTMYEFVPYLGLPDFGPLGTEKITVHSDYYQRVPWIIDGERSALFVYAGIKLDDRISQKVTALLLESLVNATAALAEIRELENIPDQSDAIIEITKRSLIEL